MLVLLFFGCSDVFLCSNVWWYVGLLDAGVDVIFSHSCYWYMNILISGVQSLSFGQGHLGAQETRPWCLARSLLMLRKFRDSLLKVFSTRLTKLQWMCFFFHVRFQVIFYTTLLPESGHVGLQMQACGMRSVGRAQFSQKLA